MTVDLSIVESSLRSALAGLQSFSKSEVSEVEQFLDAGEFGVAFETLCGIVLEEQKPVPEAVRETIRAIGGDLRIDRSWWDWAT